MGAVGSGPVVGRRPEFVRARRLRLLAGAAVRSIPRSALPLVGVRSELGKPFADFARDGRKPVELASGYRDSIKDTWRGAWWSTKALIALGRRGDLSSEGQDLYAELMRAVALPQPVRHYEEAMRDLARTVPGSLLETGRIDDAGGRVLEAAADVAALERLAAGYRVGATSVVLALAGAGLDPGGVRLLDVGTGSGYLAFALAGAGVCEVVGADLDPEGYVLPAARAWMKEALCAGREHAVSLERADAHALPYDDESFDAVISVTAGEHLRDFATAMRECRRVLRRGGLARHSVEPWFGKRGGHALCTTDFPWGHVRLHDEEFAAYVERFRPHEAAAARSMWRDGFQQPRLTLAQSRQAVVGAGYEIASWRELPLPGRDPHRLLATRQVLADCRAVHPQATLRDLLTLTFTFVARR